MFSLNMLIIIIIPKKIPYFFSALGGQRLERGPVTTQMI